jgi:hypothetical protein
MGGSNMVLSGIVFSYSFSVCVRAHHVYAVRVRRANLVRARRRSWSSSRSVRLGVISREIFIQGRQQDLHLKTSTVRESLMFSVLLSHLVKKLTHVEVIKLLDIIQDYTQAVVGVPGGQP